MSSKLKVNKCHHLYANLCNYLVAASLSTLGKEPKKEKEIKIPVCVPDSPQTSAHRVVTRQINHS